MEDELSPPILSSEDDLFWYSGTERTDLLSIDQNIVKDVLIKGGRLSHFLESFTDDTYTQKFYEKQFCLVINFNEGDPLVKKQMRVRALPVLYNDLTTGVSERFLRIELSKSDDNREHCAGTLVHALSSELTLGEIVLAAYSPVEICTTCTRVITSLYVELYLSSSGLDKESKILTSQLDFRNLNLKIDPLSNFTGEVGTCTDQGCMGQGFDCCLNGQCVVDGSKKSHAPEEDIQQALADIAIDSTNFLNWPSVYWICPQIIRKRSEETNPPEKSEEFVELEYQKDQFYCLEEGRKEFPDFKGKNLCPPSYDEDSYLQIVQDVAKQCGCTREDVACDGLGLKSLTDLNDKITGIICDVSTEEQMSFQTLDLKISGRTAPHRFFDTHGKMYDDLVDLDPNIVQEGEAFFYHDKGSKFSNSAGSFNMNAILGQITVSLEQALPARMVPVEFDETYLISTIAGNYIPCLDCPQDRWFPGFSAHPPSQFGRGLQAIGSTVNRDTYSHNISNGNYEDTIFGRACWIPPTMIPFSHKKYPDLQIQRLTRLKTQAAFYANGYQRDWYGFNKGALIGSFNGVSWFAIGTGRRVVATSKKLFLAINAPFADLATKLSLTVNIVPDLGDNIVGDFDYDPKFAINDSRQNQAGTCQFYHLCETDTHCITQLGWEYSCVDIEHLKTKIPVFDIDAKEIANSESISSSFLELIENSASKGKRCVYRGAGAPCKKNYKNGSKNFHEDKIFRCAPNFYCSPLEDAHDFNKEIVRNFSEDSIFSFGQEVNILGRPLFYLGGNSILDQSIRDNIQHNLRLMADYGDDFGLCRPGKSLESPKALNQHSSRDDLKRTDYISQLASCDSRVLDDRRIWSCPLIEEEGEEGILIGDINFDSENIEEKHRQNSCGAESMFKNDLSNFQSMFYLIEGESLSSTTIMKDKFIVRDACLRRAGSICHTDLECTPNALHRSQIALFNLDAFGGNEAERRYWKESLSCSQKRPRPKSLLTADDELYDLTLNRCCRSIGDELTMFTQGSEGDDLQNPTLKSGLFPYKTSQQNTLYDGPRAIGRYSRYIVAQSFDHTGMDPLTEPYPQTPIVERGKTPKHSQWKSFHDTGKRTCCGGGWIRKFSDGGHDWRKRQRFSIDFTVFSCLNYRSVLPFTRPENINEVNYHMDVDNLCMSPGQKGCLQIPLLKSEEYRMIPPVWYTPSEGGEVLDTTPLGYSSDTITHIVSPEVPYQPTPYKYSSPHSLALSNASTPFIFASDRITSFYLPIYIAKNNILSVDIVYFKEDDVVRTDSSIDKIICPDVDDLTSLNYREYMSLKYQIDKGVYCLSRDTYGRDLFHALAVKLEDDFNYEYAGVKIYFKSEIQRAFHSSNDLYYLSKLARFELLGVPQIFYEPLYCNNDVDRSIDHLFLFGEQRREEFEDEEFSFRYDPLVNGRELGEFYDSTLDYPTDDNPGRHVVFKDRVKMSPIFHENEFICCLQLGETTIDSSRCCSFFAMETASSTMKCALPSRTDLHVYFNRFISGEGDDSLRDDDFIMETGELKYNEKVSEKIRSLGIEFCEKGRVRPGAAFGSYLGEPNNGVFLHSDENVTIEDTVYYSIIDSIYDANEIQDTGVSQFLEGYRWNNHYYCE